MSEYQYYEFQAIDRPLTKAEQEMLRALSSRGRITATSFANHYDWGDFKGDPGKLMEDCFDLHLYLANWGTRRLMMRVPKRLVDRHELDVFLDEVDWVEIWSKGAYTIIDIYRDEVEPDDDAWDVDVGWLAVLAPLRNDIVSGDLRLFYLLWLSAVGEGLLTDDTPESLPGIDPLTGSLEAVVAFFGIDRDLVAAAAASPYEEEPAPDAARAVIAGLADDEKTDLLIRLMEGDVHIGSELRRRARAQHMSGRRRRRTVGELRLKAHEMRKARKRAEAERLRAEERRKAEEAEQARRDRLDALRRRGENVWREVETEIGLRNAAGYDRAAALLTDLKQLAAEDDTAAEFSSRIAAIRERHVRKVQFLKRLRGL
ncbi:hypothetical protein [Hoeflea sp.]|uniref:hypothetical protein n=1 Tax=Hoeflea sp. TaxID=1940281 RepID=UPI003B01FA6E